MRTNLQHNINNTDHSPISAPRHVDIPAIVERYRGVQPASASTENGILLQGRLFLSTNLSTKCLLCLETYKTLENFFSFEDIKR